MISAVFFPVLFFFFSYYSLRCNESSHSDGSEKHRGRWLCKQRVLRLVMWWNEGATDGKDRREERRLLSPTTPRGIERGKKKNRLNSGCSFSKLPLTPVTISTPLAVQGQKLARVLLFSSSPLFFLSFLLRLAGTETWTRSAAVAAEYWWGSRWISNSLFKSSPWFLHTSQMAVRKILRHLSRFPQQWNDRISIASGASFGFQQVGGLAVCTLLRFHFGNNSASMFYF